MYIIKDYLNNDKTEIYEIHILNEVVQTLFIDW